MVPPTYPTVDESLDRLRLAGWSVGDAAFGAEHALVWLVTGNPQGRAWAVCPVLPILPQPAWNA
jgi:hypothetical protein